MRKNNKGVSLIEIVVVIAIISILMATLSLSANLVFRNNAKEAANDVYAMISRVKTATLSGEIDPYLQIVKEGNDFYGYIYTKGIDGNSIKNEKEFLGKNFEITFEKSSGNTFTVGTDECIIKFDKNTIALAGDKVNKIHFAGTFTINIHTLTGYHEFI